MSVEQSALVVSATAGDNINNVRKLVQEETKTTLEDAMLHSSDSKTKKGKFWGPGLLRVQPESLEMHQRGKIRTLDRYLTGISEKYRRMAEQLKVEARSSGSSEEGVELFGKFLKEFDEKVRPIMNDNVKEIESMVREVEQTSSFYGDIETTKEEIMKLIDRGDTVGNALESYYRNNISPMGIMTQGDITGIMLDSLWSLFENIPVQYQMFISMISIQDAMASGIGSLLTFRGGDRVNKKLFDDITRIYPRWGESSEGEPLTVSYTSIGDDQESWINKLLIYTHQEISSRHLHAIVPRMEYTTVLGSNAIHGFDHINRVLGTRPTVKIPKNFSQRFISEMPSPIGAAQADRWLRSSYVRVKIPFPEHDDLKDIRPGKRPSTYKYVWGIRIVVGGPSKGPVGGKSNIGDRGYNKKLVRHMDTFRSDLLINLHLKSEGKKIPTDKPWKISESEFKLLQLVYKPPNEAKIYRLISPVTVLTAAVDLVREDIVEMEWIRSGISPITMNRGPDAIVRYKISLFIAFVRFCLTHSLERVMDEREYKSILYKIESDLSRQGSGRVGTYIHRRSEEISTMAKKLINDDSLDTLTNDGNPLIVNPIGLVRFLGLCKNNMWNIIHINEGDATTFDLSDHTRRYHMDYFLYRNVTTAFSDLVEYHTHKIARKIHNKSISLASGKTKQDLFVNVPESTDEIVKDMTYQYGESTEHERTEEEKYIRDIFSKYYTRQFSMDTKYFSKPGMEDVELPLGIGKLNTTKDDVIRFRKIASTNPPPVIIVLFDSGAPDARTVQSKISKNENFYDPMVALKEEQDFRDFPTKYWVDADSYPKENMPMSYDVEYDVDGYVDLNLFSSDDKENYMYDLEQMKEEANSLPPDDDMEMEETVRFMNNPDNRYIYIPHRTEKSSKVKTKNPYFTKSSIRKKGIATRSATVAFCDIRSLIGRSSLGGVVHYNGRKNLPTALKGQEDIIVGFESVPELHGLFQQLQWPATRIFDPNMAVGEGKGGRLQVEVIAKYDNNVRWTPSRLTHEQFATENWNRTESWGLAKGNRREIEVPLPPVIKREFTDSFLWRQTHFDDAFPGIFKHFDEVDVYRWRRITEKSGVGAIPKLKRDLSDSSRVDTKLNAYCALRFLPREVDVYPKDSSEEMWRHAINSVDDTQLSEKSFTFLPMDKSTQESAEQFEVHVGRRHEIRVAPKSHEHTRKAGISSDNITRTSDDLPQEETSNTIGMLDMETNPQNISESITDPFYTALESNANPGVGGEIFGDIDELLTGMSST